jgi:hypothetical protein
LKNCGNCYKIDLFSNPVGFETAPGGFFMETEVVPKTEVFEQPQLSG